MQAYYTILAVVSQSFLGVKSLENTQVLNLLNELVWGINIPTKYISL